MTIKIRAATKNAITIFSFPALVINILRKACENRNAQIPEIRTDTIATIRRESNLRDCEISSAIAELLYNVCITTTGNRVANKMQRTATTAISQLKILWRKYAMK